MKKHNFTLDKVCNKRLKKSKHFHRNSSTWKNSDWFAKCWDSRLGKEGNWKRFQFKAHLTEKQVIEAANEAYDKHFGKTIEAVQSEAQLKRTPLIIDIEELYHEVCALLPSEPVRNTNIKSLKNFLKYNGSPNPDKEPYTVLKPTLVQTWFAKRIQDRIKKCGNDIDEIRKEKHTLDSNWKNIKSIFKPTLLTAMRERGWGDEVIRFFKDFKEDVDTKPISAPISQADFVPVTDKLLRATVKKFKSLKYKDPNVYILYLLGIGCGFRFSESIHVRWTDLHEGYVMALPHGDYNTKGKRTRKTQCPQFIIDEIREFEHIDKSGPFAEYCVSHNTPKKTLTLTRKAHTGKVRKKKADGSFVFKNIHRKKTTWTQEVGGNPCTKTERGAGIKGEKTCQRRINKILRELGWGKVGLPTTGKKFHKLRSWNISEVIKKEGLKAGSRHAGHQNTKTTSEWYHLPETETKKDYIGDKLLTL